MAAKKDEVAKTTKQEVANVNTDYGEDAGRGLENIGADDIKIPYLMLLQDLNPEVKKKNDQYVDGAEPGMLMNSVTKELFDGDEGVIFVPCHKSVSWVEWKPRDQGGGLVARHDRNSEFVLACKKAAGKTFGAIPTDEGNELVETKYLVGYLLDEKTDEPTTPIVVSFSSTKLAKFTEIMTPISKIKGTPPLYAHRLRIRSVPDKNPKGEFHNFKITFLDGTLLNWESGFIPKFLEGGEPNPLAAFGKKLLEQMEAGARQFADDTADGAEPATAGAGGGGKAPF